MDHLFPPTHLMRGPNAGFPENQENRQSRKRQFSDSQNGLPAPKRKRLFPDTNGEDNNNSNWEWVAGEKERTEPRNTTDEVANSTSKDTSRNMQGTVQIAPLPQAPPPIAQNSPQWNAAPVSRPPQAQPSHPPQPNHPPRTIGPQPRIPQHTPTPNPPQQALQPQQNVPLFNRQGAPPQNQMTQMPQPVVQQQQLPQYGTLGQQALAPGYDSYGYEAIFLAGVKAGRDAISSRKPPISVRPPFPVQPQAAAYYNNQMANFAAFGGGMTSPQFLPQAMPFGYQPGYQPMQMFPSAGFNQFTMPGFPYGAAAMRPQFVPYLSASVPLQYSTPLQPHRTTPTITPIEPPEPRINLHKLKTAVDCFTNNGELEETILQELKEKIKVTRGSVGAILTDKHKALLLSFALADRLKHPNAKFADVCRKAFEKIEDLVCKHGMVQRTLAPTRCNLDSHLLKYAQAILPDDKEEENEDAKEKEKR